VKSLEGAVEERVRVLSRVWVVASRDDELVRIRFFREKVREGAEGD
jgi:hypothetical protein